MAKALPIKGQRRGAKNLIFFLKRRIPIVNCLPMLAQRVSSYLQKVFSIDLRSMALFRIGLGLFIIVDLIDRLRTFEWFYTDNGVIPRSFIIQEVNYPFDFSLHHFIGDPAVVLLIFAIHGVCAIALMIGVRTRLFTFLCWLLALSLLNRAPAVAYGGDRVLRMLLFWGMFLPLGLKYSVDAAMNKVRPTSQLFFSPACIGLLFQVIVIYVFAGLQKSHPVWYPNGTALAYAFEVEFYVKPFGAYLKEFPDLLQFLTYKTLVVEIFFPMLLLIPFQINFFRMLNVFTFWLFHLGIFFTMYVGLFSWICIVAWVIYLPPSFWQFFQKRLYWFKGYGLTIYYDGDCGFCKKGVHLVVEFLCLNKALIEKAQNSSVIYPIMQRENSWVVQDQGGQLHFKFDAFVCLLQSSFFPRMVSLVLQFYPLRRIGEKLYVWISFHRKEISGLTRWLCWKDKKYYPSNFSSVLVCFFIIYIFLNNLGALNITKNLKPPTILNPVRDFLRLDQSWGMFAPKPSSEIGWYVIEGFKSDKKTVNLWKTDSKFAFQKPQNLVDHFGPHRLRKYLESVSEKKHEKYRFHLAQHYCRKFNKGIRIEQRIKGVRIQYIGQKITIGGLHQREPYEKFKETYLCRR